MWIVLGLLFLVSGAIYLTREIRFIKKNNDLLIISYARLLYSCSCGFFGAILCFLYSFMGVELKLSTLVIMEYSNESLYNLFIFWFFSMIGYVALSAGYSLVGRMRIRTGIKLHRRSLSDKQIYFVAIVCFGIGLAGLLIWTSDMGGIFQYISLASALRGDYLNVYGNTHMAYRQVAKILLPATYLFFFLTLKNRKHKLLYKITFILSMMFSIFFLLCNDGRLSTVMFFLILVIGYLRYGKNEGRNIGKQFVGFGILTILAFILLANLDDITYFIRNQEIRPSSSGSSEGILQTMMQEFTFIYKSGITAVKHVFSNGKLMIVDDILFGISAYLPGVSLGDYTQVSLLNTYLCTGNMQSVAGSIPCDIISLSLYDLGVIGVIVIPLCVGITIRFIENSFRDKKHNPLEQTLYCGMILAFFRLMTYCEVYAFLTSIFPYLFLWVLAFGVGLILKNKNVGD